MSPIPFCPSLDPCAKLTPVQVVINRARIHHGEHRRQRMGVDHRGNRIRRVVKTVDEFEPECDQQRNTEQQVRQQFRGRRRGQIVRKLVAGIAETATD